MRESRAEDDPQAPLWTNRPWHRQMDEQWPVEEGPLARTVYAPLSSVDHLCKDLPNVIRWPYDNGLGHFRWVEAAGPIAERITQMS